MVGMERLIGWLEGKISETRYGSSRYECFREVLDYAHRGEDNKQKPGVGRLEYRYPEERVVPCRSNADVSLSSLVEE